MVPGSLLYLFDHQFLFLGKVKDNSEHKHHAVQIIVGIDGPVALCYEGSTKQCHCAIIAPDTSHRIDDNQTSQLHLLIDNESIIAKKLDEQFLQNQKAKSVKAE